MKNIDNKEKNNIYINYLANYENSFTFIEVFKNIIGRNLSYLKSNIILHRRKELIKKRDSIN